MKGVLTAALALVCMATVAATADEYPSRPITMIVPFAAGGPTDVVGRLVAERLSDILGQQVIVENVGGAGGMTGAQRVAQAAPDGYQVLLGTVGTQAYNQTLYKKPLYNANSDFAPVVLIAEQPLVLVVQKDLPADSLKQFAAYVKANAAKLSFGSGGSGSATHLGCVLLNSAIGVNVQHVPYRGSAPAMQDLIAGRINYLCDAVSTALPQIKAGAVRPIAVLKMEDESGSDEKIIAVPMPRLTKRYAAIVSYTDLPEITLQQIQHFFEHYKDLEPGKWVKLIAWSDADEARRLIDKAIECASAPAKG